ncbi:hypothetical protein D3C84_1290720 [compost metagenome]
MVVMQGGQALTDTTWRIEGQQATHQGIRPAADGRCIQQQGLALEAHLAHRQAETLVDQRLRQVVVGEQRR